MKRGNPQPPAKKRELAFREWCGRSASKRDRAGRASGPKCVSECMCDCSQHRALGPNNPVTPPKQMSITSSQGAQGKSNTRPLSRVFCTEIRNAGPRGDSLLQRSFVPFGHEDTESNGKWTVQCQAEAAVGLEPCIKAIAGFSPNVSQVAGAAG